MAMLDLSDDDIALLELAKRGAGSSQALDLALRAKKLHDQLYSHRELGGNYQAAIKKLYPDAPTDVDRAAPIVEPLDSRLKAIEQWREEQKTKAAEDENRAAQTDFETRWKQVATDYELSEEGEEKLLNYMKTRKLADPEAAAALYYKQNPVAPAPITPTSIAPAGWTLHDPAADGAETKLLIDNTDQWVDREIANTLTENRRVA